MQLTVLGASGATGRLVLDQALERGHQVTALARDPSTIATRHGLTVVTADVHDPQSVQHAVTDGAVLISTLGVSKGGRADTLSAGARALVGSAAGRILWLGAFGTGRSAAVAGPLTRGVLRLVMGAELADKATADDTVLEAGGTVFHAGPLTNRPLSDRRRTMSLADAPRRLVPAGVSRATVAAAMLDEAELPRFEAQIALPLQR